MKHRLLPSFYRSIGYFLLIVCLGLSVFYFVTDRAISFPFPGVFTLYFEGILSHEVVWFGWIHHLDDGITALGTGCWMYILRFRFLIWRPKPSYT